MGTLRVIFIWFLLMLVVFLGWKSCTKETHQTVKYVKGLPYKVYVKGSPDTVIKEKPIHIYHKGKVIVKHDTIYRNVASKYSNDTIDKKGVTLIVNDRYNGDTIERDVQLSFLDSSYFITRIDTVKVNRTDTVIIEKTTRKGGFVIGLGIGYAAGVVTGIVIK